MYGSKSNKKSIINQNNAQWFFLAPSLIVFSAFLIYPIISSFLLSFQSSDISKSGFVGFENYTILFKDPVFFKALKNTFTYLIFQVPIMVFLALILAVLINQGSVKFKAFFRVSLFLPAVTALVAYSMVVKLLFNTEYGLINYILMDLFNVMKEPITWLNHPIYSKIVIIIAITWRWTGYNMVIIMAGFAGINESLYESADIDGASFWQKFFSITIPVLKPVILFCIITSTIGTLHLFDESLILTNGGPDNETITIGHYLYLNGFKYLKFEYAAAISYVLLFIIGLFSIIELKLTGGGSDD